MLPKRKRDASPKGLAAGEPLKRTAHAIAASSWGWVGSEAEDVSNITQEHMAAACGLSQRNTPVNGEIDEDIIVISSDDEEDDPNCVKRTCRNNPNCLNYLGQKTWKDEEEAREVFMKDPADDARDADLPVGLKNLGATCYANASLQVWFRDMAFRSGVYNCQPVEATADKFQESPTFQLQVTFAALQESTQNVFNPTKLVESLELRTSEQQDAQEFSKLFMSHLDAEFKKQSNPALQSLITDQFQGKQVYGTICSNCKSVSAQETDFFEIEISFKDNAKLEDSINASLQEETLSGDNQYLCATCESLQDATRYTELASLPPVLHFSLLRFVFDLAAMERKKSKNSISFPTTIDMSRFLGNASDRQSKKSAEGNIYELRGVLLHKGKSAYHGHYEAQVFDDRKNSWFQFNDENVTKMKKMGTKPVVIDIEAEEETAQKERNKQRENARKRRRIDDSDDEQSSPPNGGSATPAPSSDSRVSSKDAYMLIYARRENCKPQDIPTPPPLAMQVVDDLNSAHDNACESYAEKEKKADSLFRSVSAKVVDIIESWNSYAIVSQQALESWLKQDPQSISIKDVVCSHGLYDHNKAATMKRITLHACRKITSETNCVFSPDLTSNDICRTCVEETFLEKLYQKQHPALVDSFDAVYNVNLDLGSYWISRSWLRDWKLKNPKMHTSGKPDPPPDDGDRCEHGGLCLDVSKRTQISVEAFSLLRPLFPMWEPMSGDEEPCLVCDGLKNMRIEDRVEVRRRAEDEKSKLKHMYDNALNGNTSLLTEVPCALVPRTFVEEWREWVNHPTEKVRPDRVDNSPFFCQHELLAIDPNCPSDLEGLLVVIQQSDFRELEKL
ncbi:cysteine proteinase [Roridomyces roridus]|uniref:Ubiquitin carboxyl-terminal hydrolase n=1 Tax=Roridomyces roridus TaxID=1738132 RepID=A0AAD7BX44_9AGAR|nr:cysteine proteinase [Roridomyces roridus]